MQEPRVVEAILSRYRNLIILAIVIVAQLLLLAWQVRTNEDVRLIRVWAVTTITPLAGVTEAVRRNTIGFLEDYFILLDVREQNRKLRQDNNRLKMENIYYRNQLTTAENARALSAFQLQNASKTVAARIIGNGTASSAQVVFIDRGSTSEVAKGMAVVTPDGIVGKVIAVYPLASQVLLVTDPTFAVGVESQKAHIHGTLSCNGSNCVVDYIQNEEKIDPGEWFYTSGEDRIFPRGFPVGTAASVKSGQFMKDIHLSLSGAPGAADEVLVVLHGVHQLIPDTPPAQRVAQSLPAPPPDAPPDRQAPKMATEADKIKQKYIEIGQEQNHVYGAIGGNMPNFNKPAVAPPQPEGAPKPVAKPTAPAANPAARPSGILGARTPEPIKQQPTADRKPSRVDNGPVLPLGAPRKKTPPPQP